MLSDPITLYKLMSSRIFSWIMNIQRILRSSRH